MSVSAPLLSPLAPLWPWLQAALNVAEYGTEPIDHTLPLVDMRGLAVRALTLRTLAVIGHPCPWALGEGLGSDLTAEQAGRVVAEMIRRIGSEPGTAGVVPDSLLGPWREGARDRVQGTVRMEFHASSGRVKLWHDNRIEWAQAVTLDDCDRAVDGRPILLWEEVTP